VIENALDVQGVGLGVAARGEEIFDEGVIGAIVVVKIGDGLSVGGRRGDGVAVEEFQAVPLDGIVGSGGDDAGVGVEMSNHHGDAGGGNDVEIDDFQAAGEEGGDGGVADPGSAGTSVAAKDDRDGPRGGWLSGFEERGESGGHTGDDGRRQRSADGAAHAGDAYH